LAILLLKEISPDLRDVAAVYGMGHSASALETRHGPRPYDFTKCGLRWDEQAYVHRNLKAASIPRQCEDSLRRLNVDVIHFYANPLADGRFGGRLECDGAVPKKKGRCAGCVSNFNIDEMNCDVCADRLTVTISAISLSVRSRPAAPTFPSGHCCLEKAVVSKG
jgi:hypothetical protein